jgi:hypothetical protein
MTIQKPITVETPEFISFYQAVEKMIVSFYTKEFSNVPAPVIEYTNGRRYIKIIRDRSVYAFVDKTNGNILKPASWSSPAKHARGNIFNEENGMNCCGPYSIDYLR